MIHAQRVAGESGFDPALLTAPRHHYDAGGQVAMLQANLERQLREYDSAGAVVAIGPFERLIQFFSRSWGYAMLATGYAIVGVLVANWL